MTAKHRSFLNSPAAPYSALIVAMVLWGASFGGPVSILQILPPLTGSFFKAVSGIYCVYSSGMEAFQKNKKEGP